MPLKPTRALQPPATHVLIYDAGCRFCTATAHWFQRHARKPVRLLAFEEIEGTDLLRRLERTEIESMVHFVTPAGIEYHGGEAMTRSLRLVRFGGLAGVLDLSGLRFLRDGGYALVTRLRPLLSRFIHPRR
jgi:predicted DCC family thiol-disulfide oxidoreductase YuxK